MLILGIILSKVKKSAPQAVAYPASKNEREPFQTIFLSWSPPYVLFENFPKIWEKHKGEIKAIFSSLKNFILPPVFSRKLFWLKTIIFNLKTLRNFRFSTKILMKSLS